jgi:hypothetical protein
MSDDYGYFDPHDPDIHALAEQLAEALGVPVGVHDHYLTLHAKIRDARRLRTPLSLHLRIADAQRVLTPDNNEED